MPLQKTGIVDPFLAPTALVSSLRAVNLDLAYETARWCAEELSFAIDALRAYRAGEVSSFEDEGRSEEPYEAQDFVTVVASVIANHESAVSDGSIAALRGADVLLASTNSQPLRVGRHCYSSAGSLCDAVLDWLNHVLGAQQDLIPVMDLLVKKMEEHGLDVEWPRFVRHPHLEDEEYRNAVSRVDANYLATVFETTLVDLDGAHLMAQVEIEFARAAATLALLGEKGRSSRTRSPSVSTFTDRRDRFIYEQCCKQPTMPYKEIISLLRKRFGGRNCRTISTAEGIRQAALRYAARHRKDPPPARQNL